MVVYMVAYLGIHSLHPWIRCYEQAALLSGSGPDFEFVIILQELLVYPG